MLFEYIFLIDNLANIFIKPLPHDTLQRLILELKLLLSRHDRPERVLEWTDMPNMI